MKCTGMLPALHSAMHMLECEDGDTPHAAEHDEAGGLKAMHSYCNPYKKLGQDQMKRAQTWTPAGLLHSVTCNCAVTRSSHSAHDDGCSEQELDLPA